MPTTIVRYEGTLTLAKANSYSRNTLEGMNFRVDKPSFPVNITYARDSDSGNERLEYVVDGRPFQILWRDKKTFAEIVTDPPRVIFRPAEESMGHNMLGLFFLPKVTTMMIQAKARHETVVAEPCPTGQTDCTTMVIPINPIGVVKYGQWREADGTMTIHYMGHRFADWKFVADQEKYPAQVQFREFRFEKTPLATAEYRRISIQTSEVPLKLSDLLKEGSSMQILKQGSGFGGEYSANVQDIWRGFSQQEQIWKQVNQQRSLPYGTIGAGLLGLIAFVGVGIALWRKRAGK